MKHTFGLAVVLCVFWLLLSGHYTVLMLGLAAGSIALVLWMARRMDIVDHEGRPLGLSAHAPLFWAWLGWQMLLSSWDVSRRIWTGRPEVRPVFGRIDATGMSDVVRVTYANAVTLTPGTLSVAVHDDALEIHALDEGLIRDLRSGAMARRARRMEGG